MTSEQIVSLIEKIIWPIFFVILYLLNFKNFRKIFGAIALRIESGAEIQISTFKVGPIPVSLPSPKKNEEINENHLALLHNSWRYPKKDKEFNKNMYVIQVIIQANTDVLDRIEYVKYSLHPSYPNQIQIRTNRKNNFELKELAWGEFNLRAEIKITGQQHTINLTRYINLTETGDNLLKHLS